MLNIVTDSMECENMLEGGRERERERHNSAVVGKLLQEQISNILSLV